MLKLSISGSLDVQTINLSYFQNCIIFIKFWNIHFIVPLSFVNLSITKCGLMIPWLEVYLNVRFMDHCYAVHNQSVFEASTYRQWSWFIKNLLFCHSNCWLSACLSFSLSLYFLKLKWLIRESHQVFRELVMQISALLYWIAMHILLEVSERKCESERNIFAELKLDFILFAFGVDSGTKFPFSFKKSTILTLNVKVG